MMSPLDQVSPSCIVEPASVVPPKAARTHARYTLAVAGLAHATHDGYTDMIYALLPVWQAEFALGYAALALLRGLYAGAMAALQIPAVRVAERFGGRLVLVLGTILAAVGYGLAGLSGRHPRPLRRADAFGCRVERAAPHRFLGSVAGVWRGIAWPAWDL
jgi:MFS family permease